MVSFSFFVEDGCIFKYCVMIHRGNRSRMSDLGAPAHGGVCAPTWKVPFTIRNT